MKTAFDPLAVVAGEAARAALPEGVTVGSITALPRGADAFVSTDRPLLLACTRWLAAAPGGVMLGGSPAGLASALGFGLPEKPVPVPAEERKPDDPPPPKWSELVADAARPMLTTITQAVAEAVADIGGIPPECAATQVSVNENDAQVRAETGTIPDAVVLLLHAGEHELRLVVVVPGIVIARLAPSGPMAADPEADADGDAPNPDGPAPARVVSAALSRGLSTVPLELSIEMGRARVPLSHVLQLQEGEVLELEETTDAPVDLVSGNAPVAHGDLEVTEHGNLVLHVTSIPGQPAPAEPPRLMGEGEGASGDGAGDGPGDGAQPVALGEVPAVDDPDGAAADTGAKAPDGAADVAAAAAGDAAEAEDDAPADGDDAA